ncbi:hypothetical protein ACFRCI_41845 [Streptomyces sp. NPDC056638]|uniref:hypothetical protein n=1 Tax=Streptomyces sp. NPDC056638 TaxID=3345887 RepID=UPI00368215C4
MQAVNELLGLHVTDPQAGFKAFTRTALAGALPRVTDHRLSFDTDLLGALQHTGNHIVEVGVAALHRYVDGQGRPPNRQEPTGQPARGTTSPRPAAPDACVLA